MPTKYASFIMTVDGGGLVDMKALRSLEGRFFNGVVEAKSAVDALTRLRLAEPAAGRGTALKAPPGLTMISAKLADKDPFELCRVVKEAYPEMFLALVADASSLPSVLKRMPGAAFDELMLSPFSPEELAARIELLLNRNVRATSKNPSSGKASAAEAKSKSSASSASLSAMPLPGASLDGFLLLELLKAGNGVAVYKAMESGSGSLCAVKALFGRARENPNVAVAFRRESAALARISHPDVIALRSKGEVDGVEYIVSEWVEGPSLEDYLLVRGTPSRELFLRVARDLASGLKAVHGAGLVHRDISLANVLLRDGLQAVLADFGIALAPEGEAALAKASGFLEGTRPYLAPELFAGQAASFSSDIYAYGAALSHFLTGQPPLSEKGARKVSKLLQADVPASVAKLLESCLAENPSARPSSMNEVLAVLEKAVQSDGKNFEKELKGVVEQAPRKGVAEGLPPQGRSLALKGMSATLLKVQELYSEELAEHERRVGALAKELALVAGVPPDEALAVEAAGQLHDIGRMALSFESGERKLSKEEEALLQRRHPALGARMLAEAPALENLTAMILSHHERYDGRGFPEGLSGEGICLGARILAVADSFDKLAKVPGSGIVRKLQFVEDAILKRSGLELDPALLKIFLSEVSKKAYDALYGAQARKKN